MTNLAPIFVSIDSTDIERAIQLIESLDGLIAGIKLGKGFFTAHGPPGIQMLAKRGMPFFLDLKFHDIPNTVFVATVAACRLKPAMLNVHISGGSAMMRAATNAAATFPSEVRPLVLGVTLLTSLDEGDVKELGFVGSSGEIDLRRAILAQNCGLDGVVCSPNEIDILRENCGPDFKLVVPGVRPVITEMNDQKRVMTPSAAITKGADILVIGRPITEASNPVEAVLQIRKSIEGGTCQQS